MKIPDSINSDNISSELEKIRLNKLLPVSLENLKLIFSLIDLTSLNTQDTDEQIKTMCIRVNEFSKHFPGMSNVGAVCVYPSLVHVARKYLDAPGVGIASVAAGFPSSQTFLPVKELESKMAVEAGATEIDIVISVGKIFENNFDYLKAEIKQIKKAIYPSKLKVILETGLLPGVIDIYRASIACLEAGADFIKTSTGKIQPAATPEAVLVMCHAIKEHYRKTGEKAGIKPAGGISNAHQALEYASIIHFILGEQWLDPGFFRIGASRLANHLLAEIMKIESGNSTDINYF